MTWPRSPGAWVCMAGGTELKGGRKDMALFQPTNITPSVLGELGNGTGRHHPGPDGDVAGEWQLGHDRF